MIDRRTAICVVASIAGHLALGELLSELPARVHADRPRTLEVRIVEAPEPPPAPEPDPAPPPEPEPIRPPPRPVEPPRRPARPPPEATPPPTTATTTTADSDAPSRPVFGVTLESTSSGGSGPAVPVGNTTARGAPSGLAPAGPATGPPVAPAHEVTKMPLPRGRCAGTYTDAARDAGIEGVVVLDLVVDEHGRARDIQVVEELPHGLTEAAVAAVRACRFDAGERAGVPVPVRVRGFKIRFVLER